MRRTNKIFALAMTFVMGLAVATPLLAQDLPEIEKSPMVVDTTNQVKEILIEEQLKKLKQPAMDHATINNDLAGYKAMLLEAMEESGEVITAPVYHLTKMPPIKRGKLERLSPWWACPKPSKYSEISDARWRAIQFVSNYNKLSEEYKILFVKMTFDNLIYKGTEENLTDPLKSLVDSVQKKDVEAFIEQLPAASIDQLDPMEKIFTLFEFVNP